MTSIDRLNYERFEENRDSYLSNVNVINFDIINHQLRSSPLEKSIKSYKTIHKKDLKQMPPDDKDAALAACFKPNRTDLNIEKELREEYFKEWNSSIKFVKDQKNLKSKNKKYFESW